MPTVCIRTRLFKIGAWTVLRLPKDASAKLPSRGMVMAEGTLKGFDLQAAPEPDGRGSHGLGVSEAMREAIRAEAGDGASRSIELIKKWPEPRVPRDFRRAVSADRRADSLWTAIMTNARWDWIR